MMSQTKTIHERAFALPKGEATTDNPIVPGVKVLGIESKNGRRYPLEVMKNALEKYEGAIVNIDHPAGSEPRSYEDRFGRLTNARMESDGIYADLAYNPKHPLAEGFQWWVKNDPKAIGLSHNAQAKTKMNEQDGVEEIEEIVAVDSVDLVAEPATTAGLLEAVMNKKTIEAEKVKEAKPHQFWNYLNQGLKDYFKAISGMEDELTKVSKAGPYVEGPAKQARSKFIRDAYAAADGIKKFISDVGDGKYNESAKGNRMNVMEGVGDIEKAASSLSKIMGEAFYKACKAVPRTGIPKEWHSSLDHGLSSDGSPWFKISNEASRIGEKMFDEYLKKVRDHQIEAKKRGMTESKPSKKLNVAESKRRKAIRRRLVAEALKEIFSVKKGV